MGSLEYYLFKVQGKIQTINSEVIIYLSFFHHNKLVKPDLLHILNISYI